MALFDNPYAGPYLMTTGLGLLQAAQPQPYGVNRYSYIADAVQRAGQNMMAQKDQEQRQRLFEAQMQQMARAQQERDIQNVGRQTLMDLLERAEGGTVPTGRMMGGEPETITWQPSLLDEGTKTSLMAQAGGDKFWDAMISNMYPQEGKISQTLKTVADPNSSTGWSWENLRGDKIPGAPGPTAPSTTVTLPPGEREEQKRLGQYAVEDYSKVAAASDAAYGKLALYEQIERGMEDFTTGFAGQTRLSLARAAEFFGIDPREMKLEAAASGESLAAAANKLAQMARAGEGEGTTLAGHMSDKDLQFLIDSNASIGKSPDGNRLIMSFQRRAAERAIQRAQFYDEWFAEKGTYIGARQAWNKWNRENPLFGDEDKKALDQMTAVTPQAGGEVYEYDPATGQMRRVQ